MVPIFNDGYREKSHTCEEGGPQLKIPLFGYIDELKKQLLKKLLKWANKKRWDLLNKQRKATGNMIISHLCTKTLMI